VWRDLGIDRVLREALEGRKYAFDVGRTVFASVVHRLFESGSARPWRSCAGSRISGKRGRRCEKPWNSLPVSLKGTEETGLESLRKALETSPETPPPERAAVLRELVDELRRDRDHWRTLALDLQDRLLALPSGKERSPWWWPLRRWAFG